jgi:hypothetical protein
LPASVAAPIVTIACTLALFIPALDSMGLKLNSAVSFGKNLTFYTVLIVLAWFVSIIIGCLRRHEEVMVCFIDSFGLPGIVTAGIYAAKGVGLIG